MRKLISLEWMKIRHLNTMKVILIIYSVLLPTIYLLLSYLDPVFVQMAMKNPIFEFPNTFHYATYLSSFFNLMIGVIIIVFMSNELTYKTQRQNLIDGLNKKQVILSKFIVVIMFSIAVTAYCFLVGMAFGIANGGLSNIGGFEYLLSYFISTLGYFTFALFIANVIRIPALAIIIYLLSTTVEGLLGWISLKEQVQFLPLTNFSSLAERVVLDDNFVFFFNLYERTGLAFLYIIVLVFTSYLIIKRRDL